MEGYRKQYKIAGNYFLCLGTIQLKKNLLIQIYTFSTFVKDQIVKNNISIANKSNQGEIPVLVDGLQTRIEFFENFGSPYKVGPGGIMKFIGYVKRGYLPALYAGFVMFLFPALHERFGFPILESFCFGCPFTAGDVGAHRIIQDVAYSKIVKGKTKWQVKI